MSTNNSGQLQGKELPVHVQDALGDMVMAALGDPAGIQRLKAVQELVRTDTTKTTQLNQIISSEGKYSSLAVDVHREVWGGVKPEAVEKTLGSLLPRLRDKLLVAAPGVLLSDSGQLTGNVQSVDASRMVVAYSTPSGRLELVYLYMAPAGAGLYNIGFLTASTTFTVAPDHAIVYHTSTKSNFFGSKSKTTMEWRELPRDIKLGEITAVGEALMEWSTMFSARMQTALSRLGTAAPQATLTN